MDPNNELASTHLQRQKHNQSQRNILENADTIIGPEGTNTNITIFSIQCLNLSCLIGLICISETEQCSYVTIIT